MLCQLVPLERIAVGPYAADSLQELRPAFDKANMPGRTGWFTCCTEVKNQMLIRFFRLCGQACTVILCT
ncbi:hypothetical protein D3C76_1550710 [compost metagenome]